MLLHNIIYFLGLFTEGCETYFDFCYTCLFPKNEQFQQVCDSQLVLLCFDRAPRFTTTMVCISKQLVKIDLESHIGLPGRTGKFCNCGVLLKVIQNISFE